jgi:hypothetical protein
LALLAPLDFIRPGGFLLSGLIIAANNIGARLLPHNGAFFWREWPMETREQFVHAELFEAGQEAIRLRRLKTMIAELTSMVASLDEEIDRSEKRASISDRMHFAYPTYARAALLRRDKLLRTIDELTQRCRTSALSEYGPADPIPIRYRPRRPFVARAAFRQEEFSVQK